MDSQIEISPLNKNYSKISGTIKSNLGITRKYEDLLNNIYNRSPKKHIDLYSLKKFDDQ
jgi:hypothetical protein